MAIHILDETGYLLSACQSHLPQRAGLSTESSHNIRAMGDRRHGGALRHWNEG